MKSKFYYREKSAEYTKEVCVEADRVTFEHSHVVFHQDSLHEVLPPFGGPQLNVRTIHAPKILLAVQNSNVHDLREVINAEEGQDLESAGGN